jgi:hypothetical protein
MKKSILFIILFFGILPLMHKGKLSLINTAAVYADSYAQEDCDPNDPNGDCYCDPSDPNGDCFVCTNTGDVYTETITDSDDCFIYKDWTEHYWDCESDELTNGSFINALTSLTGASLTLSYYSGNVGDEIELTAHSSSTGGPQITYTFQEFDPVDGWVDIPSDTPISVIYKIDQGGESPFRVIATSDCGDRVISDEEDFIAAVDCSTTVKLSTNETAGKPNDDVILTAALANVNLYTDVMYKFDVYYNNTWFNLADYSTNPTFTYNTYVLGNMKFRVTASYTCSGQTYTVDSDQKSYSAAFCSDDFKLQYGALMNTNWVSTESEAAKSAGVLVEYGFYAKFNGTYTSTSINTVRNPCGTVDDRTDSFYPVPSGVVDPTYASTTFTIGKFHTHPPVANCGVEVCYVQGPSSDDLSGSVPFSQVVRTYKNTEDASYNSIPSHPAQYCTSDTPNGSNYQDFTYGNNNCTYYYP